MSWVRFGFAFLDRDGAALDAVIVNTGGGMTGGDRFDLDIKVGAGADVTVTTAAAEKIYRSLGPDTRARPQSRPSVQGGSARLAAARDDSL